MEELMFKCAHGWERNLKYDFRTQKIEKKQ